MAISSIDVMQTEQIEALQDDVKELREKLNLLVSDITDVDEVDGATRDGLTVKLNQAIADASNLDDVINLGYTTASGAGSDQTIGILARMDELFQELMDHSFLDTPYSYEGISLVMHPNSHSHYNNILQVLELRVLYSLLHPTSLHLILPLIPLI